MPDVSLILASVGRTVELSRFLASLSVAGGGDCECIVVDQNPDHRLLPILAAWQDRVAIIHLKCAPGLSHARNVGMAVATGDVLAFPDHDCSYSSNLLDEVKSFFADNPEYALLSVGVRDETGAPSGNRWIRQRCDLTTVNLFRTSVGMALFVRRDRVPNLMEFDESLGVGAGTRFASGEDTDYVFRLLETGVRGRFDRRLTIYHPRRDMLSGGASMARAHSYGCGMGRVIRKHAKLPLLSAFVAYDLLRLLCSVLRGRVEPARLCAVHGRGIFAGYMAAK